MKLSPSSVRGVIRSFLERNAHLLASPILEVGSRCHGTFAQRPWMNNRTLRPDCDFVGVDMQPGEGVDVVGNAMDCDFLDGVVAFDEKPPQSVILSEVLEHCGNPELLMDNVVQYLPTDAHVLITVPFAFHVHGFPEDYWRFTPEGLRILMERVGLEVVSVETLAEITLRYSDHGEPEHEFRAPRQIGAVGVVK